MADGRRQKQSWRLPDKFRQLLPPASPGRILPQGEGELEGGQGLGVTVEGRNILAVGVRLVVDVQQTAWMKQRMSFKERLTAARERIAI